MPMRIHRIEWGTADSRLFELRADDGIVEPATSGAHVQVELPNSVGSSGHVTGESIKLLTGADVRHVAYKGVAGALNDVRAGHIKAIVDNLPSSVPLIRDGSLKPIAVTSSKRSLLLPEVPTVAESGVPGFEMVAWFGLIAPKGTPKAIVERMNAEISKALANPEVVAKYNRDGFQAEAMKPDEFRAYVVDETKKWGELVRKAGITLQ